MDEGVNFVISGKGVDLSSLTKGDGPQGAAIFILEREFEMLFGHYIRIIGQGHSLEREQRLGVSLTKGLKAFDCIAST